MESKVGRLEFCHAYDSAYDSDFWFSQVKVISTLTTPLMILSTPSLVKTSLKTLNQPFANQFEEITRNWDTDSNSKANSLLDVVFK